MSWLTDRLEEITAQVNPFDKGKTAATVRATRTSQPAQTKKYYNFGTQQVTTKNPNVNRGTQARVQQVQQQQSVSDRLRDVFDANSKLDIAKRQAAGQASNYAQQQSDLGLRARNSIGEQIFAAPGRLANTVRSGYYGATGLGDIARESLFGTDQSYQDKLNEVQQRLDESLNPQGGLLGYGTVFDSPEEARNLDTADLIRKSVGYGAETASFGIGAPALGSVASQGLRTAGTQLLTRRGAANIAKLSASGALGAGGAELGTNQNATPQSVGTAAGIGAVAAPLLGAGTEIAAAGIGRATRPLTTKLVTGASRAKNVIQRAASGLTDEEANTIGKLSEAYTIAKQQGRESRANEINRQINKITETARQRSSLATNEGGYVKVPGKKNLTKDGNIRGEDPLIQEYADMLQGMGEGNGVAINQATGQKVSNNFRTTGSGRMTKGDWYDEAVKQVKNGTADPAFMEYYNTVNNPEFKSLASTQESATGAGTRGDTIKTTQTAEKVLPTGGTQATSKFKQTVSQSPEVSDTTRAAVRQANPTYQTVTNPDQIAASESFIKKSGVKSATTDVKERLSGKKIDSQTVSDAIAVAKKLDAQNTKQSLLDSSEIYEQLATKLSEAGQTVQAASLLNNRTPEGLQYGALRTLKKAGVKVSDSQRTEIKRLINEVKKAKGDYENGLARYNLQNYVSKQVPSGIASKGVQLWKAGLLTSPRTTAGNLAANTFEGVFRKGYVDPVANALDNVFSMFTGKRSSTYTGRGLAGGTVEGIGRGIRYFKTGYDPRNPAQKFDVRNVHYSDTPLGKAAETYTQSVFKLMGAQDQPFYYAALRNSLYDQALTAAKNQKLKGSEKTSFVKKFITEPDTQAMQLADGEARYAVFQDETALGRLASKVKKDSALGEFIIPFSGVPSSIATRMITRTPIGAAKEIVKQIRSGKFDQRAMTKAIAEGTAIVPLVATGAALVRSGNMTLGYPTDKKERDLWEANGKQPYSIKVGDTWLSTNYFQPAGNLIAAGAEYQNAVDNGEDSNTALQVALAGSGKAFTEQSFLKGVSGTLNAITDPQRSAERFAEQTAGSVVPNVIRTVARAQDPYAREADGLLESVQAGIPGNTPISRSSLQERRDLFGRPVERRSTPANELANPFRPSDVKNADDQVLGEIQRLQDTGNGIVPTNATKTSFGKDTSNEKLNDINAAIGQGVRTEWDKVMNDPRYASLSDEDKKKVLDRANDTVYTHVKGLNVDGTKQTTLSRMYGDGRMNQIDYFDGLDLGEESVDNAAKNYSQQDISSFFTNAGLPAIDVTSNLKKEYAKFQYSLEGKNDIEKQSLTKSFYTTAYKSQLDDISQSFYKLGDDDMRAQLESGTISKEQMDKVIEIDNILTAAGLQKYAQVGKKLRSDYGYGAAPTSSRSSSGGSSRSKDWQFFAYGNPATSVNNSLRSLLNDLIVNG